MRSSHGTLKSSSLLPKTQRNRTGLFRTRFITLWGSEILINVKIDANALNQRRSWFLLRCTIHHICQGEWRQYARRAHASTSYGMWRI